VRHLLILFLAFPSMGFASETDPLAREKPCVAAVLGDGRQSDFQAQDLTGKLVATLRLGKKALSCRQHNAIKACHATADEALTRGCVVRLERHVEKAILAANAVRIPEPLAQLRSEEFPKFQPDCEEIGERISSSKRPKDWTKVCGVMTKIERLRMIRFVNIVGQWPDVDWSSKQ